MKTKGPKRDQYLTDFFSKSDYDFVIKNIGAYGIKNPHGLVVSIRNNLEIESVVDDSSPFNYKSVMMYSSYPRNNRILLKFLQDHKLPFYKDLNGELIPRPISGITDLDANVVKDAYSNLIVDYLNYW